MNIFKNCMKLAAVVAAVMFISACGGGDKKNVKVTQASEGNMVPSGAVLAVKVSPEQLWNKAFGDKYSSASMMMLQYKEDLNYSLYKMGELGDKFADILEDPAKSGVSMKKPIVLSIADKSPDQGFGDDAPFDEICLVAMLDDRDAFADVVETVKDLADERGVSFSKDVVNDTYTYYQLNAMTMYFDIAIAENSAVVRISINDGDVKTSMLELFADDSSEGKEAFCRSASDLALWLDMENLMALIESTADLDLDEAPAQLAEAMELLKKSSIVADLTFKDGETLIQLEVFGSEEMKANAMKYNGESTGRYFEYMPDNSVMVANIAMKDLDGLIDELKKDNDLKSYFKMFEAEGIDDDFYKGLPGQVTFALCADGIDQHDVPGFCVALECDENVWAFVEEKLMDVAESFGENTYVIDDQVLVSYANNTLTIINDIAYSSLYTYGSFENDPLAEDIAKGGFVIDIAALPGSLLDSFASDEVAYYMTGRDLLEYFSSAVITASDDHMSATITLNMNDRRHNLLEKVLNFVAENY